MADEKPLIIIYAGNNVSMIDDAVTGNSSAWSSAKTQQELDNKSGLNHTHPELHQHANKAAPDRLGVSPNGNVTVDGIEKTGGGAPAAGSALQVSSSGELTVTGPLPNVPGGQPDLQAAPLSNKMKRYNAPGLVEYYGAIPANQLFAGLGFNAQTTSNQEWVVKLAKEAGATTLRWQPGWERIEDMNGNLALNQVNADSMKLCVKYGLQPILVAAYGSPRAQLMTVTVSANVAQGAYSIPVSEDISAVAPLYSFVQGENGSDVTDYHAYYGSMIDKINTAKKTLVLAAKTRAAIPSGTKLVINKLRYAPVFSNDPNDPSVAAYCRYVRFLAQQIAANGLTGQVEIWNEPVWVNDRWDAGPLFFDQNVSPNYNPNNVDINDLSPRHKGILFNLMNGPALPNGVTINNGGTHITGFATMMQWMPTANQIAGKVATESFHPYGKNPEDFAWYNDQHPYVAPKGIAEGGNFKWYMEELDALSETGAVIPYPSVTETGVSTGSDELQAKFLMRQFLLAHSLGYKFVNVYALAEKNENYPLVNPDTRVPRTAYLSLKDFVANRLAQVAGNPIAQTADHLPQVTAYNGSWPLTVVPVLGGGAEIVFCAWQRTYGDFINNNPQAAPESVTIGLPQGSVVNGAWDTVTLQPVGWTNSGSSVSFSVADKPVALRISLAVPIVRKPAQLAQKLSALPNNSVLFPFHYDSRSTDRKAAFYDGTTHDDQHLKKNRFYFDSVNGRYAQVLPSKAHNLKSFNKQNWGWGAWVYIPDGLGNEITKSLFLTASPTSFFGSLLLVGTRFARLYGVNSNGNPVEASTLNGISTYPFRGKWRYVFCSWGARGTRLYIDGQLHAAAPTALSADDFNEPIIHSNTTDNVFVREMVFIPYQPAEEEVALWSSPQHQWLASPNKEVDQTFFLAGALTAKTYPQIWVSPYFFTLKNIAVWAGTPPAANLTVRILKNNQPAAAVVVPASGYVEALNQAIPVNAGDKLSIQAASPASGSDLTVLINGE